MSDSIKKIKEGSINPECRAIAYFSLLKLPEKNSRGNIISVTKDFLTSFSIEETETVIDSRFY